MAPATLTMLYPGEKDQSDVSIEGNTDTLAVVTACRDDGQQCPSTLQGKWNISMMYQKLWQTQNDIDNYGSF